MSVVSTVTTTTNSITVSDWIQIGIALIALCGVMAAFFAALLSWRARPMLMATKEKHSEDLKKVLGIWTNDISLIQINNRAPSSESPPTLQLDIEKNILFGDLGNHIPAEIGVLKTWDNFKNVWQQWQEQKIIYYVSIRKHLEKFSGLRTLSLVEQNGSTFGITRNCLEWLYTNILDKADGKSITLPNLVTPDNYPTYLSATGAGFWVFSETPSLFKNLITLIVDNIESDQSGAVEYNILLEARKTLRLQQEFEQLKEKLLGQIVETQAIPILAGECKHLKRASEPLFPPKR
ncbi:MAG: hypothetical protein WAU62_08090 [Dehalococcoidales bacterium]